MDTEDGKFSKFIFRVYKQSGKKGIQEFDREYISKLPNGEKVLSVLDWWIGINKGNKYLLGGKKLTQISFSNLMKTISKRIYDKEINVNMFRHLYITDFLETNPYITEKQLIADFMSHTLSMQESYRKRIEDRPMRK